MYKQITNTIEVTVEPAFLADHSRPESGVYVWSYAVRVANRGSRPVQLLRRHWQITNAHGQTMEVKGEGVVGNQPVIQPGQVYSYSSFTNLGTPSGFMLGAYDMEAEGGETLRVEIPAFSLDSPDGLALPN
jgi:ApaG protein